MDTHMVLRQLLRTPPSYRTFLQPALRPLQTRASTPLAANAHQQRYISLPRIMMPSFWAQLIPKPLRRTPLDPSATPAASSPSKPRERNPAVPFIVLALLVGSQAIQILWLKKEREHFLRRAEAKMGALREVIESVQRGEDVHVEKVLGTGDMAAEREWKEVLKEIEEEEELFRSKKRRRASRAAEVDAVEKKKMQVVEKEKEKEAVSVVENDHIEAKEGEGAENGVKKVETLNGARFY